MNDPYALLGVPRDANADAIKRAFRRAASVHHPDKGGDAGKFAEVRAAYELLSDPARRASHDAGGASEGVISEAAMKAAQEAPDTGGPCPICANSGSVRVGVKGNSNKILFWQNQPCPRGCKPGGK